MSTQGMLAAIARKRAGGAPPGFVLIYSGGTVNPTGWTASPNTLFYDGHDVYADPATDSLTLSSSTGEDGDLDVTGLSALTNLNGSSNPLASLDAHGITSLTNLSATAATANVTGCSGLTVLLLQGITDSTVVLTGCTGAFSNLQLDSCPGLTSQDFSPCVNATNCSATSCPSLAAVTITGLISVTTFTLSGNAFTEAAVDAVLVYLAGISFSGTVDLSGGTSAPPSATGLAAKATIEGFGGTVTVNGGSAGFAFIDAASADGTADAATTSPAIDSSGADLLIISDADFPSGPTTVGDSKSNSWNPLSGTTSSPVHGFLAWSSPTSVGSGQTFSVNGVGTFPSVAGAAFSGAAVSPFDQQSIASGSSATSLAAGSITPTEDNELIVASIVFLGSITGLSLPGYTIVTQLLSPPGGFFGCAIAYKIQTSASAENPTWTWTGSTTAIASIASFKAA